MSVIIRLQGLPWTASAMNIRHFFSGLNIPAGGVHIIGGEGGDAFIAFSSDEDARMAMKMNMSPLNGMPVQLFLSSKSEMQSVIDAARSGGPSSAQSSQPVPSSNIMTGVSQTGVGGMNPMGVPTANTAMAAQSHQMTGYPGMQGQMQNPMMNQKNNFQMMHHPQSQSDINPQGDATNMAGGSGMGMGVQNEWQGYPGMGGTVDNQVRNPNMNIPQFQPNQGVMSGGQNPNDKFSRFQNMGPQQNSDGTFPGQRNLMGRQGVGKDMMSEGKMEVPGQGGHLMGQNLSRFTDPGMRQSPMRGGMTERPGQFPGVEDGMKQGFVSGQRAGSMSKDESKALAGGPMGVMSDSSSFPNDRFSGKPMPGEQTENVSAMPNSMGSWGAQQQMEEKFDDKNRFSRDRDMSREQMFRQNMNRGDETPFRREGRKWPNRFAEVPDNNVQQESFGMGGLNRPDTDSNYPRDARMQDQFHGFPNKQDPMFPGRLPDIAKERTESDRGSQTGNEGGLPSTRYPPDDELQAPMPEGGRMMGGRGLLDDPSPRGMADDRRIIPGDRRPLPEDRRDVMDDRRGFPDHRRNFSDDRRPTPDNIRAKSDDHRAMSDSNRLPEERRSRPRVSRFDRDETGLPIEKDERFPPPDRSFPPEDRGFPGSQTRFPPSDRFGSAMDREFPGDDTFPPGRPFPDSDVRARGVDDRKFPPGEGRPMPPDDRRGMWPGDRPRPEDMGRRLGDNPFNPDDPRYRDREEELRREAFERGPRGPDDRFMYGTGRGGPMRGMGRPGSDHFGRHPPYPQDRRGGYPPERHERFRGDEDMDYPYAPDSYNPDGPDRWRRFDRMGDQRPEPDQRPGLLEKPDVMSGQQSERAPLLDTPDTAPLDMDQRFDRELPPGRRPGMFREDEGYDYDRGGHMEEEFGRGAAPTDFDNRAAGSRGRGGPMIDRPPRGRGEPFGRGRPGGPPPFGRGRGGEMDRFYEEQEMMDVDNRNIEGKFPMNDQQAVPERPPPPASGGRGLLGDGPGELANSKSEEPKPSAVKDVDSRPPRKIDDRDWDRRHYDDRRGRDRDDRDRHSYRSSRHDRDRERDRDRDRRRSRSRSRDRGSRGRDSRYNKDNRGRSRDKSSKSDTDLSKSDSAKSQRPTRFLSLKNMPLTISFRDVRRLFQPIEIPFDGIKLINDKDGNRVGEAFVYFNRLDDATKAQRKHGDRVEGRTITVQYTTEDDFKKAVDSFVPNTNKSAAPTPPTSATEAAKQDKLRYIVQMKNLPSMVTRQDISNFFKNLKIDKEGDAAYIEFDQEGVATGIGYVEFKTDVDYKKALTQDGNNMGSNKVRVYPGKPEEADKLKAAQGEMFQRAALRSIANKTGVNLNAPRPPLQPKQSPHQPPFPKPLIPPVDNGNTNTTSSNQENVCVHIQGLPLLATHQDIRDFFSDCQIAIRGIHIAHDGAGKPMGEGFVEFKSKPEVDKALKKDKTSLGRHIVAVKPIGRKEMQDRLQNAKQQGGGLMPQKPPISQASPSQPPSSLLPQTGGQVPKIPLPSKPPPMQENPSLKPQPPLQHQQNQPKQNDSNDSTNMPPNSAAQQQRSSPQQMGNKGLMGQAPLLQTPPQVPPLVVAPGGGKSFPPGVLNNSWFYVRCQNFPLDISIAEIMQFFHNFRPIGESIRLHYSTEGHPTGNAVVGFNSADDANRAIQRLNMMICRHNPVSLHPA